jgi:hypothetical protein
MVEVLLCHSMRVLALLLCSALLLVPVPLATHSTLTCRSITKPSPRGVLRVCRV